MSERMKRIEQHANESIERLRDNKVFMERFSQYADLRVFLKVLNDEVPIDWSRVTNAMRKRLIDPKIIAHGLYLAEAFPFALNAEVGAELDRFRYGTERGKPAGKE